MEIKYTMWITERSSFYIRPLIRCYIVVVYNIIFVNASNIPNASKWNEFETYFAVSIFFCAIHFSVRCILQEIVYMYAACPYSGLLCVSEFWTRSKQTRYVIKGVPWTLLLVILRESAVTCFVPRQYMEEATKVKRIAINFAVGHVRLPISLSKL